MGSIIASGMNMRIMPRNTYDFTGLAASTTGGLYIAQHIDAENANAFETGHGRIL